MGSHKMSTSLLPHIILKVHIEILTGFSHIFTPDGLDNTLLSQSCVLEKCSGSGNAGRNVHSKGRREGEELPIAPSMTSSNTTVRDPSTSVRRTEFTAQTGGILGCYSLSHNCRIGYKK